MPVNSSMPEYAATDHELILIILQDQRHIKDDLAEALGVLKGYAGRFEDIALHRQQVDLALGTMRQDVSRAMLEAVEAKAIASEDKAAIAAWNVRIKTLLWVGGPIAIAIGGLAQELIKRLVFP